MHARLFFSIDDRAILQIYQPNNKVPIIISYAAHSIGTFLKKDDKHKITTLIQILEKRSCPAPKSETIRIEPLKRNYRSKRKRHKEK
jgi:hypothetical protein